MIDVHCHLNFHAFHKDFDEVTQRAFESGVKTIINVGTKLDSSQKAVQLAEKYDNFYAIVGIHPHHADKKDLNQELGIKNKAGVTREEGIPAHAANEMSRVSWEGNSRQDPENWFQQLEILAKNPKVVAIGEIGLDYYSYQSNGIVNPKLQKEIFEAQIELAYKLKLPLQIHGRHAGKDILEILNHHKNLLQNVTGMFHCFAGDLEILKGALDLGFYIGFDGNLTYSGLAPGETVTLSEICQQTPLDKIVTETDSPFLTPIPFRGSRNEPKNVILVGEKIAQIKNLSIEKIDQITTQNAQKLFRIKS